MCKNYRHKKSDRDVLGGVHSGEKGWQKQKAHIAGQTEAVTLVPAGAVENPDQIIIRVAAGDFVEEYLHAVGIDMRQY